MEDFSLKYGRFQPRRAYKAHAYKKSVYAVEISRLPKKLNWQMTEFDLAFFFPRFSCSNYILKSDSFSRGCTRNPAKKSDCNWSHYFRTIITVCDSEMCNVKETKPNCSPPKSTSPPKPTSPPKRSFNRRLVYRSRNGSSVARYELNHILICLASLIFAKMY